MKSFLGSIGKLAGLVVVFAMWLRADLFRLYTLATVVAAITLTFVDPVAAILVVLIWMLIAILVKVKTMWKQVALITTLLTSMFATAVLLGGIPAIHNPPYAALAIIGFTPIIAYVVYETFATRKTAQPADQNDCSRN